MDINIEHKVIKIKKLTDTAKIPTRGSNFSAGYDLYADEKDAILIPPHTNQKIHTGLSMEIPKGHAAFIFARSGLATKEHLRPANCVGVCDCDYRGEYMVSIHNDSDEDRFIMPNERIAQMIVLKHETLIFMETDELSNTTRGTGGFGSTGK